MTNTKTTKKALLLSVLSIIVCFSMLVGSTFAWFTDKATTGVNKIVSGNLDIVLEVSYDGVNWLDAEGETLDFVKAEGAENEDILWEPGCTYQLPALRVRNNGNLWVKYQIVITGIDGDAELNNVIEWTVNGEDMADFAKNGTLEPKKDSGTLTVEGHMLETAGNEYMNKTIDGIAITVFATQLNHESDSFGPDYDKLVDDFAQLTGETAKELSGTVAIAGFNIKPTDFVNGTFTVGDVDNLSASQLDTLVLDGGYITTGVSKGDVDSGFSTISVNAPENSTVVIKNATIDGKFSVNVPYPAYPYSQANVADLVFENCVINGAWMGYPNAFKSVTFKDCIFTNVGMDLEAMYTANCFPVWFVCDSDTEVNFVGCTFEGNRAIHINGRNGAATVNVEGCTFNLKASSASNEDITKVNCFKFLGNVNATLKNNTINSATAKFDISGDGVTVNESGSTVADGILENRGDVKYAKDDAALASILGGDLTDVKTIYLAGGEYEGFDLCQNWGVYEISIIGATNSDGTPATVVNVDSNVNLGLSGEIKNIVFKDTTNSKIVKFMDGNGLHADVALDNCLFDGASMQFTGVATVKNCVFDGNGSAWSGIQYSAPTGDILIEGCKFSGYTFTNLQVTDEGAHKELTVTVKDCVIGKLSDNAVDYAEGVTLYVDTIVLENNTIDCDVWTPSFAKVTKTNNMTSDNGEVSYKNW